MSVTSAPVGPRSGRPLAALDWSPRIVSMCAILGAIWLALDVQTNGVFLTPRNLYNLAVQSSVVAVMATGMVWVIVARHIDLSVGSVVGFTGMAVAVLQVEVWADSPWAVLGSIAGGLALGAAIGAWQGYWVAWRGVPAFVVTLAGLLVFRGGAFLLTDGRTVAPLDSGYQRLGGGLEGSIGATWSAVLGAATVLLAAVGVARARAGRLRHGIRTRPVWAELLTVGVVALAVTAFVAVMNAHTRPRTDIARGIPIPVLIALAIAAAMTWITRATRFGRYVFAIGGSPEAAKLAGIDVRRVTLGIFVAMGLLSAVGGVIATARLGAGTNSLGTLAELSVIAAAVIGGTSLAGGVGSVGGAVLGAVIMQSLENGMVLMDVSSPLRQVTLGLVLIVAVWADAARRRGREP